MPRIYKISMDGDFGDADSRAAWTVRKADIPRLKRQIREACHNHDGRAAGRVEEIEFSLTKAGVIALLNAAATRG